MLEWNDQFAGEKNKKVCSKNTLNSCKNLQIRNAYREMPHNCLPYFSEFSRQAFLQCLIFTFLCCKF